MSTGLCFLPRLQRNPLLTILAAPKCRAVLTFPGLLSAASCSQARLVQWHCPGAARDIRSPTERGLLVSSGLQRSFMVFNIRPWFFQNSFQTTTNKRRLSLLRQSVYQKPKSKDQISWWEAWCFLQGALSRPLGQTCVRSLWHTLSLPASVSPQLSGGLCPLVTSVVPGPRRISTPEQMLSKY